MYEDVEITLSCTQDTVIISRQGNGSGMEISHYCQHSTYNKRIIYLLVLKNSKKEIDFSSRYFNEC